LHVKCAIHLPQKVIREDEPMTQSETLSAAEAEALLRRQAALQAEATAILTDLDLIERLKVAGSVRQIGSSTLGLMVWRDIDLAVSSSRLTIERAVETMRSLFLHPQVRQVRYINEAGVFNPTGLAADERFYFQVYFDAQVGEEWKLDISFWLVEGVRPEPVHEAVSRQLTPETRLAILWIKDVGRRLPSYRTSVSSADIYDAVLQHGIRTPVQFNSYLLAQGKPTESALQGLSDESRVEPEDDGGEHDHPAVIEHAFLVMRCQSTPLFEPIDSTLV
jgi:hypothetical protein